MERIESFFPIINDSSKVIILGSMPGEESLRRKEYYGNPRNHFWRIIFSLFNEEIQNEYDHRIEFLKKRKIALWDVLSHCEREGSLDSKIKNEVVNDFETLFKRYLNIRFIGFNGSKAYNSFKDKIGFDLLENHQINYKKLPSTSPIPGRNIKTLEEKLEDWKIILDYID